MTTTISVYVTEDGERQKSRRKRETATNLQSLKDIAARHGFEVRQPLSGNEWQIEGSSDNWRKVEQDITKVSGLTISMVKSSNKAEASQPTHQHTHEAPSP